MDTRFVLNAKGEVFDDINEGLRSRFASYEKVDNEYQHLVNGTASLCNVMGRYKSHPIMKYVMEELMKSSNIPTACPVKKVGAFNDDHV